MIVFVLIVVFGFLWIFGRQVKRMTRASNHVVVPGRLAKDPEFVADVEEAIDRAAARKWIGERMRP